ncbi:putative anaphase-promoting complex subunit 10 [Apostichopus japonicus]|uniref:Anaphase-promoting complex subunit 10 n=1 Tax=Stichopus japonicus TaxID=307972 RepID=A0A2G8JDI2_STIJA|nr:putative anaphase-promoting complex subunit 10 [Apostichopus japonicus]
MTSTGISQKELDEYTSGLQEIGEQAVWSLSSCKPGFGIKQLRDNSTDTYWQSDGTQPHLVNIQFRRKTTINCIAIYADFKSDESYTPNKVSIRAGNNFHDLQEIETREIGEPCGWICIDLKNSNGSTLRTFMLQVAALSNHQNGRDTHMRQIKVFGKRKEQFSVTKMPTFTSKEFSVFSSVR